MRYGLLLPLALALTIVMARPAQGQWADDDVITANVQPCAAKRCLLCNTTANACLNCTNGYGFDRQKLCRKCYDSMCQSCIWPSTCLKCYAYGELAGRPFYPVYKDKAGKCQLCINHPFHKGCKACRSDGLCKACAERYSLQRGRCVACTGKQCLQCPASPGVCTTCAKGFRPVGGVCVAAKA